MTEDIILVGTDTDAGKTTFAISFLSAHREQYAYWKPVETGQSDTETVRRRVPGATIFDPLARFVTPVAPAKAARLEGRRMPRVSEVLAAVPSTGRPLLIETFGSPLSPFDDETLQIELIRALRRPVWLVTSSAVGAIGRALQALTAMRSHGVEANRVVLIGARDEYAEHEIHKHYRRPDGHGIDVLAVPFVPESLSTSVIEPLVKLPAQLHASSTPGPSNSAASHPTASGLLPLSSATSRADELLARDRVVTWHPYTSLLDPIDPVPVVRAEAEYLHLADGRKLIDAVSSWWTILHGHCHPPLVHALREAAATLDHVLFAGATHPPAVELAEYLLATVPWPTGGRVFFSDNGSTAIEVAMKMAYQFWCHQGEPHRTLFVGFDDCYHGDTFAAMAVSRDPVFFGRFEPFLFQTARVPISAERLDDWLAREHQRVAAVLIEPLIQAAGGMKMHRPAELAAIAEVCQRYDVLLIADEVMTAHRTGRVWAFSHAAILPDLIASAKTLTGGMLPLAVTLASPAVAAAFATADRTRTLFHGHSFTANPLACAVAVANARCLQSGQWQIQSRQIQHFWEQRLPSLRERPEVRDVRVCGTVGVVELRSSGGYLAERGQQIRKLAIDHGVLLRPLGNVLYAMPPLTSTVSSLERIFEVLDRACNSV